MDYSIYGHPVTNFKTVDTVIERKGLASIWTDLYEKRFLVEVVIVHSIPPTNAKIMHDDAAVKNWDLFLFLLIQALMAAFFGSCPKEVSDPSPLFPQLSSMSEKTPPQTIYQVITAAAMPYMEVSNVYAFILGSI